MSKDRAFEDLRSLGEFLRQQVSSEASKRVATAAVGRRRVRRSRRWFAVVVTAALLAVGNGALARASDSAIPGDLLYPFDRVYEWLGDRLGSKDRIPERVQEALALAEAGETDRALSMVREILAAGAVQPEVEAAVAQLVGSGNSEEVRNKVKDLVAAASLVHEAAQTGDPDALQDAITNVKEVAADVAETASDENAGGNENGAGNEGENSSVTAPSQTDNPSGTAPGQTDNPSGTAPGQTDNASGAAPGQGNSNSSNHPDPDSSVTTSPGHRAGRGDSSGGEPNP